MRAVIAYGRASLRWSMHEIPDQITASFPNIIPFLTGDTGSLVDASLLPPYNMHFGGTLWSLPRYSFLEALHRWTESLLWKE